MTGKMGVLFLLAPFNLVPGLGGLFHRLRWTTVSLRSGSMLVLFFFARIVRFQQYGTAVYTGGGNTS